jgi:hypothetical protein
MLAGVLGEQLAPEQAMLAGPIEKHDTKPLGDLAPAQSLGAEHRGKRPGRPAVFEDVQEIVPADLAVDRHGYQAGLQQRQAGGHPLNGIGREQDYPFAGRQPAGAQPSRKTSREVKQLGITPLLGVHLPHLQHCGSRPVPGQTSYDRL